METASKSEKTLTSELTKRIFIGIEFTTEVKQSIALIGETLKAKAIKGRFTDTENYHLTLHFIGLATLEDIEKLETCLMQVAKMNAPFTIVLTGTGYFQKRKRKILWLGAMPSELLDQLYALLMENYKKSFNKENGLSTTAQGKTHSEPHPLKTVSIFTPHITLGREVVITEDEAISKTQYIFSKVEAITLFESVRINGNLVYRPLSRYRL